MKEIKFNEICNCFKLNVDIEGVKKLEKYINNVEQEKDQLENNWKELKKYIGKEWYCFDNESVEFEVSKDILDKMQEIESGKNEENS